MKKISNSKNSLKENILLSQSRLNFDTSKYQKYHQNNISRRNENERSFDNFDQSDRRQKDLAEIQKKQIYLKNMDKESDLFNTRLV